MSLIIQGLQSLLGSNPYTSSVGNFIFGEGDDQDIYSGGGSPSVDTSSSESAFADLIGSDEAFADLYNALQNDPDSVYNTINPIGYDPDSLFGNLLEIDPSFGDKLYDGTATTTVIPQGVDSDAMQEYLNENTGIFGLGIDPKLQARDLRRTAITEMAEAGVDLVGIMQVSGHQSPSEILII